MRITGRFDVVLLDVQTGALIQGENVLVPGSEFFVVLTHAWQENELDRFESAQTRFRVRFNYTVRF